MRAAGIFIFVMPAAPKNMARSAGRISCCLGQHLAGADADRAAWLICARGREFRSASSLAAILPTSIINAFQPEGSLRAHATRRSSPLVRDPPGSDQDPGKQTSIARLLTVLSAASRFSAGRHGQGGPEAAACWRADMDGSASPPARGRGGRLRALASQYRASHRIPDARNRSGIGGCEEEISALRIAVRQAHTNNVSIPQCPALW
jgi:hypothetical protein